MEAKKIGPDIVVERLFYFIAVILMPSIVLFYLYNKNADQGIVFEHCPIFGGILAGVSLALYFVATRFIKYRRALEVMIVFWVEFWLFKQIYGLFYKKAVIEMETRGGSLVAPSPRVIGFIMLLIVVVTALWLRSIKTNRLITNTVALVLCGLFAFNFVPAFSSTITNAENIVVAEQNGGSYEIKTEFNIDSNLPHPNVYWIHMDGMMGFDAVEKYFGESQTELKKSLAERGLIINLSARLEAGYTHIAVPAMTSPTFYDSFLADVFKRVSNLTRSNRESRVNIYINENGVDMGKVYDQDEIQTAFRDAGYLTASYGYLRQNAIIDFDSATTTDDLDEIRKENVEFAKFQDFFSLYIPATALQIWQTRFDEYVESKRPVANTMPIPEAQSTIDRFVTENSDSRDNLAGMVRAMSYAINLEAPHFIYFFNGTVHVGGFGNQIGDVIYEEPIGRAFWLDENGDVYKEKHEDPRDVMLYYPQHKYAAKEMLILVDVIIESDPDAIIILQGDHGIHGIGREGRAYFDQEYLEEKGWNLEAMLDMNLDVMSAVYIPEKYGEPDKPLDPLNIARWLVNHFVGEGNYDYLPQENGGTY
ncbi:MAG: hypothetical protein LBL96_12355 [Clostridiales bacterium]|nr:hypothetical protein [Clostridiales bacterium]